MLGHLLRRQGQLREDPAVDQRALGSRATPLLRHIAGRIETVHVRVNGKERVDVPKREGQLALHGAHARERVAGRIPGRIRCEEEPAEGISAGWCRVRVLDPNLRRDTETRHRAWHDVCIRGRGLHGQGPSVLGGQVDDAPRHFRRAQLELDGLPLGILPVDANRRAIAAQIHPFVVGTSDHGLAQGLALRLRRLDHREFELHSLEDDLGGRVVALALRLLLALAVGHVTQDDARLVGMWLLTILEEERRNPEQGMEPTAGLVDGLGNEVGWEVRLELLGVPVRVAPLGERHRASVEPDIDHLGNPTIDTGLTLLRPGNPIDPGLVDPEMRREIWVLLPGFLEGIEGGRISLEDVGHRRRHIHGPGLVVDPDVQRSSPEAFAR